MKTLNWNTANLSKLAGLSAIAIIAAGCGNTNADTSASPESGNTLTGKSVAQNFEDTGGGVSNAVSGAGDAAENVVDAAGNTAGNVADAAGNVADAAGNTASSAGAAAAGAAAGAGVAIKNAGSAAVNTPTIKSAIGANKAMAGSNIDVDSNATSVTLKGTVKSAMQKSMASTIAKKHAGNLKIVNNLTVKK